MISDDSRKLIMRWPAFQQELESMAGYIISQREALPDFMTTFIDNMIGVVSDSISGAVADVVSIVTRSEEHTSELQSRFDLVCRLLLEKKNYMNDDSEVIV